MNSGSCAHSFSLLAIPCHSLKVWRCFLGSLICFLAPVVLLFSAQSHHKPSSRKVSAARSSFLSPDVDRGATTGPAVLRGSPGTRSLR